MVYWAYMCIIIWLCSGMDNLSTFLSNQKIKINLDNLLFEKINTGRNTYNMTNLLCTTFLFEMSDGASWFYRSTTCDRSIKLFLSTNFFLWNGIIKDYYPFHVYLRILSKIFHWWYFCLTLKPQNDSAKISPSDATR